MLQDPEAQRHHRQLNVLRHMIKGLEAQMIDHQEALGKIQEACKHNRPLIGDECLKCGMKLGRVPAMLN